jgi:hypothetical protein
VSRRSWPGTCGEWGRQQAATRESGRTRCLARTRPPARPPPWPGAGLPARSAPRAGVGSSVRLLEHAQDVVTAVVGAVLIVLAGILLIALMAVFIGGLIAVSRFERPAGPGSSPAPRP